MNFSSCVPAKKASHFPVNEPHDLVIVNYAVGLGKVVMHEAHIWVGIDAREENISF